MQVTCLSVHPAGMAPKTAPSHRFPALGRQEQRKGIARGFCFHGCVFISQESGECFGRKSSVGAAKEAELGDVEGNW